MSLPTTRAGLEAAGYEFAGEGTCKGCGEYLEWFVTPNDKRMPFSVKQIKDESKTFPQPVLREERIPHHAVCPAVDQFRRK